MAVNQDAYPAEEEQLVEDPGMTAEEPVVEEEVEPLPRRTLISPERMQQAGAFAAGALDRVGSVFVPDTVEANGDDLSDLFEGPDENDLDIYSEDLVDLDEEDVFGEGGADMSDLVDVSYEDIMGPDLHAPIRKSPRRVARRSPYYPGGMSGVQ